MFSDCNLKGLKAIIVVFLSLEDLKLGCALQIEFIFDVIELDQASLGMLHVLRTH